MPEGVQGEGECLGKKEGEEARNKRKRKRLLNKGNRINKCRERDMGADADVVELSGPE